MERASQQENPLEIKDSLSRTARIARLRYFSAELGSKQSFDRYEIVESGLRRKITSNLNSIIQKGGRIIIIDFPYASGRETARIQVISKTSYLRQLFNPPRTREFRKGHFSVSLTRPAESNVPGALNFGVKDNFGKEHVYTTSWNEEEAQERRFTVMSASGDGWRIQLDFKWPEQYDSSKPSWKVDSKLS